MFSICATATVFLFAHVAAQDPGCDYSQDVQEGQTYYVYNKEYPNNYTRNQKCRWIGYCANGFNCKVDCNDVVLPYTEGCVADRILISETGDPQLTSANAYCGTGRFSVLSAGRSISLGFQSTSTSLGGRFLCQLTAQRIQPKPEPCRCGYKRTDRIVGGVPTGVNEYPMMAGIVDVQEKVITCGAVIISPYALVGAAHCSLNQDPNFLAVLVGEHDVNTGDSPATALFKIKNITPHPRYKGSSNDYDISVITIVGEIQFSSRVGPVCMPFKYLTKNFTGEYVTAVGWGTQFFGGPVSDVPRKVDLQVISQYTCRKQVSPLTNRQICTYTPGKDACQVDSGGPLLYTEPSNGLLYSIGVISFGTACASKSPGVNTRVTEVLNWIIETAPQYNYCVK